MIQEFSRRTDEIISPPKKYIPYESGGFFPGIDSLL
jgi:hypothetical protein